MALGCFQGVKVANIIEISKMIADVDKPAGYKTE